MGNISSIFKSFYDQYDRKAVKKAYNALSQRTLFADFYKKVPFSVEIRMKNDIFAMQISSDSIVSVELMTVIGFFFEKYSADRNCVWTQDMTKVKKFFCVGISEFTEFGGNIKFNITPEDAEKIIFMLEKNPRNKALHKELCDNLKMLENMCWEEYENTLEQALKQEEADRHIEEVTCMDLPLDWENVFAADTRASGIRADSVSDGLLYSLNNLGRVDIEYIAQITGEDCKAVISALKGSIFQNPDTWNECFYKGWETADEYLSGRVVEKWEKARKANIKYNGYFEDNVKALDKIIPNSISADNIYITLGSPWVPPDVIDDFIAYAFAFSGYRGDENYNTVHDEAEGVWEIPRKNRFNHSVSSETVYGTKRMNGLRILENTLNMKSVVVTDEVSSTVTKSGTKRVINKEETLLAQEKQKKLIQDFKEWVWKDKSRKDRLQQIYDEKYCSNVTRNYNGHFLSFPEMNPDEHLYDYQKNAVARIMFSPNTLLAHDVGAGKTYIMIAAGMEMRRIGMSKKNLYVVPNTLVGQWKEMFLKLYPNAKLLCVEPNHFTKDKRAHVMENIRDNDYDGIIMAYSSFELIPISKEYRRKKIKEQLNELKMKAEQKQENTTSLNKKIQALNKLIADLENAIEDQYDLMYFDELGINTLYVDEAHNFKNVPIQTQIKNVLGISAKGSAKCADMMDKVRIVQKQNNGRGVVFATGTPIANSLTDIFVMQKYLQSGELALLDLQSFDSWVGMFAEKKSEFEIDVDTNQYRLAERFTQFHNLPELSTLLSGIADFHRVDTVNGIPEMDGYQDIIVSKTSDFDKYLQKISDRADDVRKHLVKPKDDNMLKITTDGRKAALDLRLVDDSAAFTYQSKVAHCAENVFDIYRKTQSQKSTQLIFCDTSTPKESFNLYDELRRLLVSMGVNDCEIAYIHDAKNEKEREALFKDVQKGNVRVLIGSTFKLGLGVNVQDKLVALHHLDVPWRPSDMIQREGRILRKGNENKKVAIYRYMTEGSFDAYSWQLLESKQRTISEILAGCMTERMCKEIADTVLDYAEVKAISIGNPLLKERFETANRLVRNITLQRKFIETRQNMETELAEIPNKIARQNVFIENCEKDIEFYSANKREYDKLERKALRERVFMALSDNELSIREHVVDSYQGFAVIIPANMLKAKPFLYLAKNGRYYVEMGLSETGVVVRLDNCLDGLGAHLEKLKENLSNLYQRKTDIETELEKKGGYAEKIEVLKKELHEIDERLGVNYA